MSNDNSRILSLITTKLGLHMKSGCGQKSIVLVGPRSND